MKRRARAGLGAALGIWVIAVASGVLLAGADTEAASPPDHQRPLVFAIVIDGLDGDSVDAGKAPFISSLLSGQGANATYFPESRSVMPSVTNTNHTAMMTGAYAGDSGIAGNEFALYAPLENGDSCAATGERNRRALPTTTSGENLNCPQAAMVYEAIKRQGNPDDLATAGIFGKPKLGRIFAGRNVNRSRRDADYLWAPCASGPDDDEYCGSVPTNPVTGYGLDDATVMDEVIRTVRAGVPVEGETVRPDFTFVNLHQVDSAGHLFGRGLVYDAVVGMADREIERLVTSLRSLGEWERTVMILLSDHSIDTTPTKVNLESVIEDGGVAENRFHAVMGDNGMAAHIYLADRQGPDRFALLKQIRASLLAEPAVAGALYREPNPADGGRANTVAGARPEWHVAGARSGDIFVTAEAGKLFASSTGTGNIAQGHHGSNSTRDNFFAVIGGGSLVRQRTVPGTAAADYDDTAENPQQAENVDVAATVMGLFGLFPPADSSGRFLSQAFNPKALRATSRPYPAELSATKRGVLSWTPKGGLYDLQVRAHGRWKPLLRKSARGSFRVGSLSRSAATFRIRSYAASGIPSAWRVKLVQF